MKKPNKSQLLMLTLVCAVLGGGSAFGARIADVRGTLHNLSAAPEGTPTPSGGSVPSRNIKATSEDQVCVFCHTPHGATMGIAPLWNRKLSSATYTPYSSSSLDAEDIKGGPLDNPGGSSKLCLSCHDGTLAIGDVNVLDGRRDQSISMSGGPNMPTGNGATTGYTRNLGVNLTNDHPISVAFTRALAQRDGELRQVDANQKWPNGTGEIIGVPSSGYKPKMPLEVPASGGEAQIQCASCHDPHIRETVTSLGNQKFLRLNRFQESAPTSTFSAGNSTSGDIICLACHERGGNSWAYSAHANPLVATPTYVADAAQLRQFPENLPVWKAACLNCHDTHTVQGSRRLLREGTDSSATPKADGKPAIEETCFQCHSTTSQVITPLTNVPPIKQDFELPIHMPIKTSDQTPNTTEVHDIGGNTNDPGGVNCTTSTNKCGADFVETRNKLGLGNLDNRHAECTDCHNPHRVVKFTDFRGANGSGSLAGSPDSAGTHKHTDDTSTQHTNIASGVLRGAYGVEPVYGSASFHAMPTSFDAKRGDPGPSTDTSTSASYVTREYQICLKCHSNYGYADDNVYPVSSTRPNLGSSGGSTPPGVYGLTQFTNQAKEFQAPPAHRGEGISVGVDGGAAGAWNTYNHRGWHPVMDITGRTASARGMGGNGSFLGPWKNNIGNQTMYCTDCHGSNTDPTTVIPTGSNPWGPHGSTNSFLLKGVWYNQRGSSSNLLCFKCHTKSTYSGEKDGDKNGSGAGTGFAKNGGEKNLHLYHNDKVGPLLCTWCHVAVPHGWKNKQLLVNLNDVGPEAGLPTGTFVSVGKDSSTPYTQPPYYSQAVLHVRSFAVSGHWDEGNCGGVGGSWDMKDCKD